ncbi:MAG: hypothetical protein M3Y56_08490 [Armatimonadota bacterium]|nr:hypothetical protein [Armatimonadota bacterium]
MKKHVEPPGSIRTEQDDGAWTEEEARRLLQGAYEAPPPDHALLSRVEKRVLASAAAEGPLRSQQQRLFFWIGFWFAGYLLLLAACAWFGNVCAPDVPRSVESVDGAPHYTGVHYTAPQVSYPSSGERTRP